MTDPTEKTIKRLFALSGNICAYPGCNLPIVESTGTITGEICHIKARKSGGPRFDHVQSEEDRHGFANLVLMCRHHHKVVDAAPDIYTADALQQMKAIHENVAGRKERDEDEFFAKVLINDLRRIDIVDNRGNIAINSPGVIQAHTVNVKTSRKSMSVSPPPGTIGADQDMSRYVQYLIKRYNEFAGADKTRTTRFSYGALSKNIERQFGTSWKLLSADAFDPLSDYLQQRISKTIMAKLNTSKGHRAFSTYAEFLAKTK